MISKILKTISEHKMLEKTKKVVIGLSGGADSVSLTHALLKISKEKNFEIEAVHVNHGIRGSEAERDENFSKDFCQKLGIKLTVRKICVPEIAKKLKLSTEEAGRMARYEILNEVAGKEKSVKIATAHTLSDNIETLIMRLASGTSLKGLCGIPPTRENIIRPLIEVKREEIEKYCKENNLNFVDDSSNFERDYTRNKIRLDIIPRLKSLNPNFENTAARTLNLLKNDEEFLEKETEKALKSNSLNEIIILPAAVKSRALLKIMKNFTQERIEEKHIKSLENLIIKKSGKICIPGGKMLELKNGEIALCESPNEEALKWEYLIKPLNILTEIETNIIINVVKASDYSKKTGDICIDFDKIPKNSVIRNRRAGDKFTFKKRGLTKSIKKIFSEMKIPITQREKIPLIASKNEVIWCENLGVSKNYIPSETTEKIALIKIEKYSVI